MNFEDIYNLLRQSIIASVNWFYNIIESCDAVNFYFVGFILILSMTYFIFPLLASSGRSDSVRKRADDE